MLKWHNNLSVCAGDWGFSSWISLWLHQSVDIYTSDLYLSNTSPGPLYWFCLCHCQTLKVWCESPPGNLWWDLWPPPEGMALGSEVRPSTLKKWSSCFSQPLYSTAAENKRCVGGKTTFKWDHHHWCCCCMHPCSMVLQFWGVGQSTVSTYDSSCSRFKSQF